MTNNEPGGLPLAGQTTAPESAVIRIEGQEFELERALAEDDATIKSVLRPHYAALENANITREEKNGRLHVTIVKRAQHKGTDRQRLTELELLDREPETFNPALGLAARLGQTPLDRPLTELELDEATAVLDFSRAEIARIERLTAHLAAAAPTHSNVAPVGF